MSLITRRFFTVLLSVVVLSVSAQDSRQADIAQIIDLYELSTPHSHLRPAIFDTLVTQLKDDNHLLSTQHASTIHGLLAQGDKPTIHFCAYFAPHLVLVCPDVFAARTSKAIS